MPDRIELNGRWYVAEDTLEKQQSPPESEPYELLGQICREYGVNHHRAHDARRAGLLDARLPNGNLRGYRVRRSEFLRWMEKDLMGRRDGLAG